MKDRTLNDINCSIIIKNCKIIDQLIEKHIQHIETKIKELTSFKSKLYELRQSYTSNTTIYHYKIVKNLGKSE